MPQTKQRVQIKCTGCGTEAVVWLLRNVLVTKADLVRVYCGRCKCGQEFRVLKAFTI